MSESKELEQVELCKNGFRPCKDFDEDCPTMTEEEIWYCWLYMPERGTCLRLA